METETPLTNDNEDIDDTDNTWEDRILCSDGNCIGVIGADGRCKECGMKYEGELPEKIAVEKEEPAEVENEAMPAATEERNPPEESPADDDWEHRVLCSDGNCIGVIGPDGKCKECGKPME
jgi:hypothetical protein